jgi:hypothetical protein
VSIRRAGSGLAGAMSFTPGNPSVMYTCDGKEGWSAAPKNMGYGIADFCAERDGIWEWAHMVARVVVRAEDAEACPHGLFR